MIRGGASDLAIFGGQPLFAQARTPGQLANRDPERFFALAAGAFERRWFTNQGPLISELEERLGQLHGAGHCVAFANASFAMILALRAVARPGAREVVLPALAFSGLPHLIRWAGLEPRYCEVDPGRHTLDSDALAGIIGPDTAVVLAADQANALCDIDAIEALTRAAGVPLVLDSVHGIGGSYGAAPVGSRGTATIFSLHADTLINGFEGGYLTTQDPDLAAALIRQRSFGFGDVGVPVELGLNAKLNELHVAMALSNLPHLPAIVADNAARLAAYRTGFADLAWTSFADYSAAPGTDGVVLLKVEPGSPFSRDELIDILRAENALVRPHHTPLADARFPIADRIAGAFIRMPAGDLTTLEDVERLAGLFARLEAKAGSIVDRLRRSRA